MKNEKLRIFAGPPPSNQGYRLTNKSEHSISHVSQVMKDRSQEIYNNRRKNSTLLQTLMPNTYIHQNVPSRQTNPPSSFHSNLVSKVNVKLITKAEGTSNPKVNRINPALLPSCLKGNVSSISNYSTSPSNSSKSYHHLSFTRETQYNRSYKGSRAILQKLPNLQNTLSKTHIVPFQRAKMINWLIEVVVNYPEYCQESTLHRTIIILDLFLKAYHKIPLENKNVHLIGICSFFIASKYEDMEPIPLEEVCVTIGHSEFSKEELLQTEQRILEALNFCISYTLPMDVFTFYINSCPRVRLDELKDQLMFFGNLLYLIAAHEVQFNNYNLNVLMASILIFILRYLDLRYEKSFDFSYQSLIKDEARNKSAEKEALAWLATKTAAQGQEIDKCIRELRQTFDHFESLFPKCCNAKKYYTKYQIRFTCR